LICNVFVASAEFVLIEEDGVLWLAEILFDVLLRHGKLTVLRWSGL